MTHLLVRVEVADFDAWLRTHLTHAQDRRAYGMTDGPIYDRATRESTTMHRDFYLAERQEPRDQADSSGATLIGSADGS